MSSHPRTEPPESEPTTTDHWTEIKDPDDWDHVVDRDGHPIVLGYRQRGSSTTTEPNVLYCKLCGTVLYNDADGLNGHWEDSPACRERILAWLDRRSTEVPES